MGILSRTEKRLIESHLRRYETYRNIVDDYYARVDESGHVERVGGAGADAAGRPGNPTERVVIAAMEPPREVHNARKWLGVHRMTRSRLSAGKVELMERVFYRNQSPVGVQIGMHIEARTYQYWRDDVVTTFALCAALKGVWRN